MTSVDLPSTRPARARPTTRVRTSPGLRRRTLGVLLAHASLAACLAAQDDVASRPLNLDFEQPANESSALPGWLDRDVLPPAPGEGYEAERVTQPVHGGRGAALLARRADAGADARFGTLGQSISCDPWLGRRLRLSGWLRTEGVTSGAGLWMRVDGEGTTLAFDNMSTRFVTEDSDWTHCEVVLDVDRSARRISFGVLLLGEGRVFVDDLSFEVVDASVPSTAILSRPPLDDSPAPAAVRDWITRRAVRISSLEPAESERDLASLPVLVGDARLVVLGEPVRATREVLALQRRILERLVDERGFDTLALDSGLAETLYLGLYVTRGRGDPRALAREVLPWHRQSEDVLDLIEWLRERNESHPHNVRLVGIEALGVEAGLRSVTAFLERVDADRAERFEKAFLPLSALEDERGDGPRPSNATLELASSEADDLLDAFDARREAWSEETSNRTTERARQLVVVLRQVVAMAREPARAEELHVAALLDNIEWELDQDPESKVVLLLHDRLLLRGGETPTLGDRLHERFGDEALLVATTVRSGGFRAWPGGGEQIETFELPEPPTSSLEAAVPELGVPAVLLDLRALPPAGPVRAWFDAPHVTRLVDGFFLARSPDLFLERVRPGKACDLLLQIESVSPDRRLPDDG
ncbi:MAG: erythromycin esterase family protein [Planctomycetes bacterium]|nr:erythromycin esterase family protein [Planctomycetota bacterium]